MLEALRESDGARGRLLALAAALDAGVVDGADLRRLNRLMGEIADGEPCLVRVPDELLGAVAYACACWDSPAAARWLGWALSARLDRCLVRDWLPGPGLGSVLWQHLLVDRGFGRGTHWICEMPVSFWQRLESHSWPVLNRVVAASDPDSPPQMLAELARCEPWTPELGDLVASHPRTPKRVLEKIALTPLALSQSQRRVAQNLNAGRRVLTQLAEAFDEGVRFAVALNPRTPSRVRAGLAGDVLELTRFG